MKLANSPTAKNNRRIGALARLEGNLVNIYDNLDGETQEKRIKREIAILESKIQPLEVARASRSKRYKGVR